MVQAAEIDRLLLDRGPDGRVGDEHVHAQYILRADRVVGRSALESDGHDRAQLSQLEFETIELELLTVGQATVETHGQWPLAS
ncbi:MAG: hypothetical protein NVS3B12_05530 [Acidimicrobiales bacterium]